MQLLMAAIHRHDMFLCAAHRHGVGAAEGSRGAGEQERQGSRGAAQRDQRRGSSQGAWLAEESVCFA